MILTNLVNIPFLGIIFISLSSAIYARLYLRRSRLNNKEDVVNQVSPTAKSLVSLSVEKPDYTSTIKLIRNQARMALKDSSYKVESSRDIELLISLCDGVLKRKKKASDQTLQRIGSLYSYLNLEWRTGEE